MVATGGAEEGAPAEDSITEVKASGWTRPIRRRAWKMA